MTTLLSAEADARERFWQRAVCVFLAEKERRSGSMRTVDGYARLLSDSFGRTGRKPDAVGPRDVFSWADGVGQCGRQPSTARIGSRLSCESSLHRFAIRVELLQSNPCDPLERPKMQPPVPRGLSAEQVRRLLAVIPDSEKGRRDRAIVLMLAHTGRCRSEVPGLRVGNLSIDGGTPFDSYRGKGGKHGRRELPAPVHRAIVRMLGDRGQVLEELPAEHERRGMTAGTFCARFRRSLEQAGLPVSGLHVLRHTAAKLRRDAGESVEAASAFLDHSSLAVTTTHLRRLEGARDGAWEVVAGAIGVEEQGDSLRRASVCARQVACRVRRWWGRAVAAPAAHGSVAALPLARSVAMCYM